MQLGGRDISIYFHTVLISCKKRHLISHTVNGIEYSCFNETLYGFIKPQFK